MSRSPLLLAAAVLAAAALATPADAWHGDGHRLITRAAVKAVAEELPPDFSRDVEAIAEASVEPDLLRALELPALRAAERPDHFINSELLRDEELPRDRYRYLDLLHRLRRDPAEVGLLPYTVVEGAERLAGVFALLRRHPVDAAAWSRARAYAGDLAHYAGDLGQPLHVTVHHDGRRRRDGSSPRTGIHARVDGLLGRVFEERRRPFCRVTPQPVDDLWEAVRETYRESHALVDDTYALDAALRHEGRLPPAAHAFARDRFTASAAFLAGLYLHAWERSEELELPEWAGDD